MGYKLFVNVVAVMAATILSCATALAVFATYSIIANAGG